MYLTDFGLAREAASRGPVEHGQWMGTAEYVAPEQIEGGTVSARTDVYSLGCVLVELLTGDVPFNELRIRKLFAHSKDALPSIGDIAGPYSGRIDQVLARATQRIPRTATCRPATSAARSRPRRRVGRAEQRAVRRDGRGAQRPADRRRRPAGTAVTRCGGPASDAPCGARGPDDRPPAGGRAGPAAGGRAGPRGGRGARRRRPRMVRRGRPRPSPHGARIPADPPPQPPPASHRCGSC